MCILFQPCEYRCTSLYTCPPQLYFNNDIELSNNIIKKQKQNNLCHFQVCPVLQRSSKQCWVTFTSVELSFSNKHFPSTRTAVTFIAAEIQQCVELRHALALSMLKYNGLDNPASMSGKRLRRPLCNFFTSGRPKLVVAHTFRDATWVYAFAYFLHFVIVFSTTSVNVQWGVIFLPSFQYFLKQDRFSVPPFIPWHWCF